MSENEPSDEHSLNNDGGSAADGEQTVGSMPTPAPEPATPTEPSAPEAYVPRHVPPSSSYAPSFAGDVLPGTAGDAEVLTSGPTETPRRNVTAIVLSVIAVVAVAAGSVTYLGYHKLAAKGSQPDKWAPASSIAYIKLDLDPSASTKLSALQFEQKFPSAPKVTDAANLKDALLDAAFQDKSNKRINYAADVKPWLGSRVAIAVYADASGKPQPIGILEVKDATKAKAGLAKVIQEQAADSSANASSDDSIGSSKAATGYAVEGDYAIVGSSQAAVDAAVAAAGKSNIGSNSTYTGDVATLQGDRIVTAWTDLDALLKLAERSGAAGGAGMLMPGGLSGLGAMTGNALQGRAVAGLRVQAGYAEIEGRIRGSDVSIYKTPDAARLLKQLPSGSLLGLSVSGFADIAGKELDALRKSPLIGNGLQAQLDAIGSEIGIALPADALNLLGNQFAASLDSVSAANPADTKVTVISEPTNAAKGLETAQKLAAFAGDAGFPLTASAKGAQVVVTNNESASGSLGNDAGFQSAMSGMPDKVVGAAYVNLSGIWKSMPSADFPADVKHLDGLGLWEGIDGSDFVFAVRLTVK